MSTKFVDTKTFYKTHRILTKFNKTTGEFGNSGDKKALK